MFCERLQTLTLNSLNITTFVEMYIDFGKKEKFQFFFLFLGNDVHPNVINTLWTGDADLCLYITTVQDG